ncbi:MAG: T9SS type A sorting domain-containing protein [Bacteroidota bacterium]
MNHTFIRVVCIGTLVTLLSGTGSVFGQYSDDWTHIPRNQTFDVVTWNIEWFGDERNGPNDTETQYTHVLWVIQDLQPDLMSVQEIADADQFRRLLNDLDDYSGFLANYSQTQQVGFIYNTNTVDSLFSSLVDSDDGQSSYAWAGRFPLEFVIQARIGTTSTIIYNVGIHAKAFSDSDSYDRRVAASKDIKDYFDESVTPHSALIFLGDYNDDVIRSTRGTFYDSPYKNFLDDSSYSIVTETLSLEGAESWKRDDRTGSMIDHITVNHHLSDNWLQGSEMVYVPDYISDFSNTTSDHRPVYARFDLSGTINDTSSDEDTGRQSERDTPRETSLLANFPNPFNPATTLPFHLAESARVTLTVFNSLGQQVAQPILSKRYGPGTHSVRFDARDLPSGMYFYRLEDEASGWSQVRKMAYVK